MLPCSNLTPQGVADLLRPGTSLQSSRSGVDHPPRGVPGGVLSVPTGLSGGHLTVSPQTPQTVLVGLPIDLRGGPIESETRLPSETHGVDTVLTDFDLPRLHPGLNLCPLLTGEEPELFGGEVPDRGGPLLHTLEVSTSGDVEVGHRTTTTGRQGTGGDEPDTGPVLVRNGDGDPVLGDRL